MKFLFLLILSFILMQTELKAQELKCETAGELMSSNASLQEFQTICQQLVNSDPACLRIVPENRLNCDKGQDSNRLLSSEDILSKVGQCLKGFLWDSLADLGGMIVDLISTLVDVQIKSVKSMAKFLVDDDFRNDALKKLQKSGGEGSKLAMDFLRMASAYFSQEFTRNLYDNDFNLMAALGKTLFEPLVKMLTNAVEGIAHHYISEYQCLNGVAKSNTICKAVGSLVMPPTAIFAFLKGGKAALVALEATSAGKAAVMTSRASFSKLNHLKAASNLSDAERLTEAAKLLGDSKLSKQQMDAIIEAHKIGIADGRGFYTYTQADIAKKARILREAGFDPAQTRLLMERGITGTFANPNTTSLANSARVQAQSWGLAIGKASERGADITSDMAKYKSAYKEAAENYTLSADIAKNPLILKMGWESAAKAGDVPGAIAAYKKGIDAFGMNTDKMLQGVSQDIAALQKRAHASPKDPMLALELKTMKEVEAKLKAELRPAIPMVAKPAIPIAAPTVPKIKSVDDVSPREARDIANRMRLDRNPEEASKYYLKASTKQDFSDTNFLNAFDESLKGNGTIASQIISTSKKNYRELNKFVNEMFEREMHNTRDPVRKANLRRILEDIENTPSRERGLYNPQESMLKTMLKWTKD